MPGRNSTRGKGAGRGAGKGNYNRNGKGGTNKTTVDTKEMKFVPKVAGKTRGIPMKQSKNISYMKYRRLLRMGKN